MTDYRQHLLEDEQAYRDLWNTDEAFRSYSHAVYHYLDRMPRGTELRFDGYPMPQLRWVIWTCCVHWWSCGNGMEYNFRDDFSAYMHEKY